MEKVTLVAADGARIAARVYEPDGPLEGNVVIGGAMGVRQDFYAPFAQWLAGQGWRVTTFDYRGSGDSAPPQAPPPPKAGSACAASATACRAASPQRPMSMSAA